MRFWQAPVLKPGLPNGGRGNYLSDTTSRDGSFLSRVKVSYSNYIVSRNFGVKACTHVHIPLQKSILSITYSFNPISPLSCPEHHIRTPGETRSGNANIARNFFPFLKIDIISRDNMGKQRLNFIDRKESSGAESKS
jgi:hypothetical protein